MPDVWAVSVRCPGGRWSSAGVFATRPLAIAQALTLKASGSEVLVRASTFLDVHHCASQMALPGALVGRFDCSSLPVALRPSRRSRARSRSTGTPSALPA